MKAINFSWASYEIYTIIPMAHESYIFKFHKPIILNIIFEVIFSYYMVMDSSHFVF